MGLALRSCKHPRWAIGVLRSLVARRACKRTLRARISDHSGLHYRWADSVYQARCSVPGQKALFLVCGGPGALGTVAGRL